MSSQKSKAIPFIAGFFILILLGGFALGLRTVIEFDPVNAQMKTTKYIFLHLPVSSHSEMLWITTADMPYSEPDWHLMHEIHNSAGGTKIKHTHWGSTADTILPWGDLALSQDAKPRLAARTLELINSDYHYKAIRIYARRIDIKLKQALDQPESPLDGDAVDALFDAALVAPIDAEANMIPDP